MSNLCGSEYCEVYHEEKEVEGNILQRRIKELEEEAESQAEYIRRLQDQVSDVDQLKAQNRTLTTERDRLQADNEWAAQKMSDEKIKALKVEAERDSLRLSLIEIQGDLQRSNAANCELAYERDKLLYYIVSEGHDCEFHTNPEKGACSWCEMTALYRAKQHSKERR